MKRKVIAATAILLAFVLSAGCAKAEFEINSLEITPDAIGTGETATVKVDVTNVGKAEGTYTATLTIDGTVVETKDVTATPRTTQTVTFSIAKEAVGDYNAEVGGLTGTLHVVKPAEFVFSNLKIQSAIDQGEGYYHITVDVENIGALPGIYQIGCKVNDNELGTTGVELNAGEKKTVTLIAAESTIHELAANYKNEVNNQREHTVSIGSLSENVTFAARPVKTTYTTPAYTPPVTTPKEEPMPKLQILRQDALFEGGNYARIMGEVKNISDESLADVQAVAGWLFYTKEGKPTTTKMSSLIKLNPLLPGKTSQFEVGGYLGDISGFSSSSSALEIVYYTLSFQTSSGVTILSTK